LLSDRFKESLENHEEEKSVGSFFQEKGKKKKAARSPTR
jgi:hypothetical protein